MGRACQEERKDSGHQFTEAGGSGRVGGAWLGWGRVWGEVAVGEESGDQGPLQEIHNSKFKKKVAKGKSDFGGGG